MPSAADVDSDSPVSRSDDGGDDREEEEEEDVEEVEEGDDEEEEGYEDDDDEGEEDEAVDGDAEDASPKSEFGGCLEDLKFESSAPGNSASIAPINTSDNGNGEVIPEKKLPTGSLEDVRDHSIEGHGGHWNNLSTSDAVGTLACIPTKDKQYVLDSMTESSFKNGKPNNIIEKEASHVHTESDLHSPSKLRLSGKNTPQRRSRSSSPCDVIENMNKKPAIRCDFFARGWCIKGNSCKFLHQRDGAADAWQATKEELAGQIEIGEPYHDAGLRHETERLKPSGSCEPVALSCKEGSVKSKLLVRKALIQAYGADTRDLPTPASPNMDSIKADNSGGASACFPSTSDSQQTLLAREERKRSFDPHSFQNMNERKSAAGEYLHGKYFNEQKIHHEMPKTEYPMDMSFSNGAPLGKSTLVGEYKYHPSGQYVISSLYPTTTSSPFAYDKKASDLTTQSHLSHSLIHDSGSPFHLSSSLNPNFSNPLQPAGISASVHSLGQAGDSRGSGPLSAGQFDNHKAVDLVGGYYSSRSSSLPRISSPYMSNLQVENRLQPNCRQNSLLSSTHETQFEADNWEPSVPFRSSFCPIPIGISSPRTQYDPLLDSIDPPSARSTTFLDSLKTIIQSVSSQTMRSNRVPSGAHSPGENNLNHLDSVSQSNEGFLGKNENTNGTSAHGAVVASPGLPKENNPRVSPDLLDGANARGDDHNNLNNEADKGKGKESKSTKIFRSALVDFLKVLVKPYWKEGRISKDDHKMIIKKAVEKVLGTLQPHHIPSTAESIDQYLLSSRPKLVKLLEGYVVKYAKS